MPLPSSRRRKINPRACYWAVIDSRWDALFIQHRDQLSRKPGFWRAKNRPNLISDFHHSYVDYVNNCEQLAPLATCVCVANPRWNTQWPEPWTMCFLMLSFPSNPLVLCKFFPVMFAMREYIYDQRRRCFIKCWCWGWLKGRLHTKCLHSYFFWSSRTDEGKLKIK